MNQSPSADFVAIGLSGTNLMAMLWSVAMGRRVVGVDDGTAPPDLALGRAMVWRVPADAYHQLGLVDQLMVERYGVEGVPRHRDGSIWRLAESLYAPRSESGGTPADKRRGIGGLLRRDEFVDERRRDGAAHRVVDSTPVPDVPVTPDPSKIRTSVSDILEGPSLFHVPAARLLAVLREYLEAVETMDLGDPEPRVRLFPRHRLCRLEDGLPGTPGGGKCLRIEALDGAEGAIDIGVPELFVIDRDAEPLGFRAGPLEIDHQDGRGTVMARSHFIVCPLDIGGGRSLRRIASVFDEDGDEYWVRQVLRDRWLAVQVPEHMVLDPAEEALVSAQIDADSAEYFDAYLLLLREVFIDQAQQVLALAPQEISEAMRDERPRLVTVTARTGTEARVADNGVVAGGSFGTGHFLDGGDSVTGLIGHGSRVLRYWRDREAGIGADTALRTLAAGIAADTRAWIDAGFGEFGEAAQFHFNADCHFELERARRHRELLAGLEKARRKGGGILARPHTCEAGPETEAVSPPSDDFFRRWVSGNPLLGERRELLARWLDDPTPREDIAKSLGIPLGTLLRSFNDTAPLTGPVGFSYRGIGFTVVGMDGVCDDIVGDRFPRFGTPLTLRCYLDDGDLLPQQMFEIADWNYMDAGRPGFVGYVYGVAHGGTFYLAGVQSDLAARYSYLFQGRGDGTDVRAGDEVEYRGAADLAARFGRYVPVLRRTFQRYWIDVLLGAVAAWGRAGIPAHGLTDLGLLQFALEPEEDVRGHVVHRVYREMPERLECGTRCVRLAGRCHVYKVATLTQIIGMLGSRWAPEVVIH